MFCYCQEDLAPAVKGQFQAAYPDCHIEHLDRAILDHPDGMHLCERTIYLSPDIFPIKTYERMEDKLRRLPGSSLTALLATIIARKDDPLNCTIAISLTPAPPRNRRKADRTLRRMECIHSERIALLYARLCASSNRLCRTLAPLVFLCARTNAAPSPALTPDIQAARNKLSSSLFSVQVYLRVAAPKHAHHQARTKLKAMAASFGIFTDRHTNFLPGHRAFLLTAQELATIIHPPPLTVRAEKQHSLKSRTFEPPPNLPTPADHPQLAVLGKTHFRDQTQSFGILPDDRFRHLFICGKTGMGKSALLTSLISKDIAARRGLAVLDPHSDLIADVLATLPHDRSDIILFDPADREHPLAFNILHCESEYDRPLVASGVVSGFKKLYGNFWGPRLERFLRSAALALLEVPGSSILTIQRFLTDAAFRKNTLHHVRDDAAHMVWSTEFKQMKSAFQAEVVAPIQNKLGAFLDNPMLRNIFGQADNRLEIRRVMDEGQVLLAPLSKGKLGEDASMLIGSFLVTKLQLEAMKRDDAPKDQRRDFFLYIDEFQNYATDSFATILSEARKYRLGLTMANQYLSQLVTAQGNTQLRDAIFGNVGSVVAFAVGPGDDELLAKQFNREEEKAEAAVKPKDLRNLPKYHALVRLLIDGESSQPFTMQTFPPPDLRGDTERLSRHHQHLQKIRNISRHRHSKPRATVENELRRVLAPP